ncbi:coiled-coil domain-containing protein 130 homolog [Physella acuta]|uniref:coiled-coil domain-containing protein 130 homolog n=1 Tax=Physella acuta TaxID=109671 RepID=UPI0027DC510B|nr:coiled-coil domain-containing protein 130 homolog [Physella acuta]
MAERKAVNKYYPPDWDPRKGSANKRVGQHPLRDRARKLSQGILVIRFELPYNIWCGGCGSHVGMGVRYNAEKSKVGNYYSTPIYKFRMKCHLCDNYFEIQTDPKNHDYVILCGARRKEQRWDPVANEQVVPEDKTTQKKLATDPMFKLEHGSDDKKKGSSKVMGLAQIEESRLSMKEDYILNRMARDQFREEKKELKKAADADEAILARNALDIELVEEAEEDKKLATLLKYSVTSSYEEKEKEKRKSIEQRPLFVSLSSPAAQGQGDKHLQLKKKLEQGLKANLRDPFSCSTSVGRTRHLAACASVVRRRQAPATSLPVSRQTTQHLSSTCPDSSLTVMNANLSCTEAKPDCAGESGPVVTSTSSVALTTCSVTTCSVATCSVTTCSVTTCSVPATLASTEDRSPQPALNTGLAALASSYSDSDSNS